MSGRVAGQRQPGCTAKARSQRSSEWKLKPNPAPPVHCIPLETHQATLCTRTADLCLVIYPLTMEKQVNKTLFPSGSDWFSFL